ncbi:C-type lectin domain family 9 member A-like [Acomys russatus]|uniref:C-type lectin domain family 9 member A-like n=1 Tax=Acomys russatus TaxID=60746 RepID=UPI0021E32503|nr:C-type lectin domain family 9 member A-like [Acomys russatus]
MSEERPIYAELKLSLKSKEDKNQEKRECPWCISAVILGIICLCLLMSNAVLGYLYFQGTSNFKNQHGKDANESTASAMEVMDSSVLPPITEKDCYPCHGRWICCGEMCYYFSEELKTWEESKASCRHQGSRLAKIDNRQEQSFIQSRLNYSHWVGLRKRGSQFQWVYQNDTKLSSDVNFKSMPVVDAECGYLKPTSFSSAPCARHFHYICEKKFTCLVTSKNG